MEQKPKYCYDEEGDILYITFYPGEKGTGVELNEQIILRFNKAEERALGLTILDFSVLAQTTEFGPRSFPLTGLANLPDEMRKIVVKIITTPPVSHLLRVLTYSPSPIETIPITYVQRPFGEAVAV